eukprot:1158407-Pelagomonas_calceolata.AAC.4
MSVDKGPDTGAFCVTGSRGCDVVLKQGTESSFPIGMPAPEHKKCERRDGSTCESAHRVKPAMSDKQAMCCGSNLSHKH